jgi:hypothetical protein
MSQKVKFVHVIKILFLLFTISYAQNYKVGYGLNYSLNTLKASKIDNRFTDFPNGGHSSFFFLEIPFNENFSMNINPGAMNYEHENSQFHIQYNYLIFNYFPLPNSKIIPIVGIGLGACIVTLSKGEESNGEVQNGVFLKDSVFNWILNAGLGYNVTEKTQIFIEIKEYGFLNDKLNKMNSLNLGGFLRYQL